MPAVAGSVKVTEATPEELVVPITLVPLVVPLESVPAEVVNKIPAPVAEPPGLSVTLSVSVAPGAPDWLLPVCVSVAGGLPTTIQPPLVCVAALSLPVTV